MKKVKAGKEGADARILGVFSAYRGANRQPRGRYMDLVVSHCIHMYLDGADRNTFGFMYRGCIGCVLCMTYSTYVLQMYLHTYPERQLQIHAEYI